MVYHTYSSLLKGFAFSGSDTRPEMLPSAGAVGFVFFNENATRKIFFLRYWIFEFMGRALCGEEAK